MISRVKLKNNMTKSQSKYKKFTINKEAKKLSLKALSEAIKKHENKFRKNIDVEN